MPLFETQIYRNWLHSYVDSSGKSQHGEGLYMTNSKFHTAQV